MDEDATYLERHFTLTCVLLVAVFVLGVLVQVQSALWAPLQKLFLGF